MNASLVFDGTDEVRIPESMGTPNDNQLQGTAFDRLSELCSRVCYDSLGCHPDGKPRGRSSEKLHAHILEVKNHSVYRHANFTLQFEAHDALSIIISCVNRKGIWIDYESLDKYIEVTANLCAVLEWDRYSTPTNRTTTANRLKNALVLAASELAPHVFPCVATGPHLPWTLKTEALTEDQAWITLYMYGSRGYSHEQVRHQFAISQRSTRYVDEDESPYIIHPLIEKYFEDDRLDVARRTVSAMAMDKSIHSDRQTYHRFVEELESYCADVLGLDRFTARKQARGAARGFLGNALATEMLFSAPVSGWKWMLDQRKSALADAEIRAVFSPALAALKSSRYGDMFATYEEVPSPDGIGTVLKKG